MAILKVAKLAAGSFAGDKVRPARGGLVPRGLIRFSLLLTIGMAVTTIVLTLIGMITGDFPAIAALGIMAMATWLAITFFMASLVIVFRCLVELCERMVAAFPWPSRRIKLQATAIPTGVNDDWLDGPY